MKSAPSLIVLDWGTSSLRAFLLDASGNTLDTRFEPWGVSHVPNGNFPAALNAVTADWCAANGGLNVIASGMVGSTRGWVEAPYCSTPAGIAELVAKITTTPGSELHIIPGIMQTGQRPDVMRGEETQIVGTLSLQPQLTDTSTLVLPGTHSKWVTVTDGNIENFVTYMTGELFSVLREHSMLGAASNTSGATADPVEAAVAFDRGVAAAQDSPLGISPALFTARSRVMTHDLDASASLHYLSGLLIGDEIRCGLSNGRRPDALIGDAELCTLYAKALYLFGMDNVPVIEGAAQAGLWRIACDAGLVPSSDIAGA